MLKIEIHKTHKPKPKPPSSNKTVPGLSSCNSQHSKMKDGVPTGTNHHLKFSRKLPPKPNNFNSHSQWGKYLSKSRRLSTMTTMLTRVRTQSSTTQLWPAYYCQRMAKFRQIRKSWKRIDAYSKKWCNSRSWRMPSSQVNWIWIIWNAKINPTQTKPNLWPQSQHPL